MAIRNPKLLPCPFCGSDDIDPAGWASADRAGRACMECSGSADTIELWNSRVSQTEVRLKRIETALLELNPGLNW